MNEGLKLALFGIGGYLVYEYLFGSAATATSTGTVASGTSIAPSGVITTSVNNIPATVTTGQVAAKAASGSLMTSSEWNYYQNLDNPGGNIILGGTNVPGGNISYAQWQAAFNSLGVVVGPQPSGNVVTKAVGATLRGLGHIINLQDLATPSELGWGIGDDEFEYGLGAILQGAKVGSLGFHGLGGIVDAPENNAAYIDENIFNEAAAVNGGLDSSSQDFYLAAGLPI